MLMINTVIIDTKQSCSWDFDQIPESYNNFSIIVV